MIWVRCETMPGCVRTFGKADGVGGVGGTSSVTTDGADTLAERDGAASAIGALDVNSPGSLPDLRPVTFPGPVAEAFYWDDSNVVGIQGPVGSGKTTTLLYSRLRRAKMMPRSVVNGLRDYKLTAIRHTYRDIWSTTIPSYVAVFPKAMGVWSGGRGDPVTHVIEFADKLGPIRMTTEFKAFGDSIEDAMRGLQTTDMWMNEMDTMPVDVFTDGITRIGRWPGKSHFRNYPIEQQSYGQIVGDFNAPEETNWTFGVFHDEKAREAMSREMMLILPKGAKPISISFHRQPGGRDQGAENLHNLAPSYYATAIAGMKLAGRGDKVARLIDNKVTYIRIGTPVFEREFRRRIHVSDVPLEPDPELPLLIGLDQGLIGAAVIAQFRPPMHWRILAEMMFPRERLLAKVFGGRLRDLLDEQFSGFRIEGAWGDMAGEQGSALSDHEKITWNSLVGQTAGFTVRPQIIGSNRIDPRLEAVRAALEFVEGGEPGIVIDPGLKYLPAAFEARYVWTDEITPTGDKRKLPDKRQPEANVMDALQYLLLSRVRGDGLQPNSFRVSRVDDGDPRGMPVAQGLRRGFDVLNPY